MCEYTVDREIFTLKIIHVKIFRVIKFLRFRSIRDIFLTVDNCSMDEHLESSWGLLYYQVSGEPGIAGCNRRSDIYLGNCPTVDLRAQAYSLIIAAQFYFSRVKFSRLVSTVKLF